MPSTDAGLLVKDLRSDDAAVQLQAVSPQPLAGQGFKVHLDTAQDMTSDPVYRRSLT